MNSTNGSVPSLPGKQPSADLPASKQSSGLKAQELLSSSDKWTQSAYARNADGQSLGSFSEGAVCWCLSGAIMKCYRYHDWPKAMDRLKEHINQSVEAWNDHPERTYEEVLALVKELDL